LETLIKRCDSRDATDGIANLKINTKINVDPPSLKGNIKVITQEVQPGRARNIKISNKM
jgi:hypothetical protein